MPFSKPAALVALCLVAACRAGDSRDSARLDEQCYHQGDAAACSKVAAEYLTGRRGRIDEPKALAAYGRGCEAGDVKACNAAGEGSLDRDRKKAEDYRRRACDLGSGEGCLYLSGYVRERGGADAVAQSEALYHRGALLHVKACRAGDADACFGAGAALSRDDEAGAEPYYRDAVQRWQRQCDSGDAHSCHRLGAAYRGEKGVSFDAGRARTLLDKACAGGVTEACADLALALDEDGQKADAPRAASLFERACAAGSERHMSCRQAGFLYAEGDRIPADKPRAARLLDNGCALGDDWCCFKLGTMLTAGDGIPADRPRGADLTRSAEGLEFRILEVRRGKKMVDPGLTAFGIPAASITPTAADPGQELVVVAMEARRSNDTARLPVRKVFLIDTAGRLHANHVVGDPRFGDRPLERREFLFKVPAGLHLVRLQLELGGLTLDLPPARTM